MGLLTSIEGGELNRIIAIMGNAVVKPCLVAFLAMTMKGTAIWEKKMGVWSLSPRLI